VYYPVCVLLCFVDRTFGESLRSRGCSLCRQTSDDLGWQELPLHPNVAVYTGPLLFLFERTDNHPVDNQRLLPWRLHYLGESNVRLASPMCDPDSNWQIRRTVPTFNLLNHKRPCHMWRPVDGIEPKTQGSWTAPRWSHCTQIIAVLCRVIRIVHGLQSAKVLMLWLLCQKLCTTQTFQLIAWMHHLSLAKHRPVFEGTLPLKFPSGSPASCWGLLEATTVIKLGLRHPRKKERNNWARWCLSHDAPSLAINASKQLSVVGSMGWGSILQPEILNGFRKYNLQIFWVCWSITLKLSPRTKLRVQNCLTHLLSKNRGI